MIRESIQSRIANTAIVHEADEDGFARAVKLHSPQIFRFLFASLRDADLAETLTQDCFLKALNGWSAFRGEACVKTWLTRIAMNIRNDFWRNCRARFWRHATRSSVDIDIAGEFLQSPEPSPEAHLAAREQLQQVWKFTEALSEKQRTVFLLRYVEELNLKEIAYATGMGEGTVKAHLSRALGRIRCGLKHGDPAVCASL